MSMSRWKLLAAYVKQNLLLILTAAGSAGIFLAVIALYQLPAETVGYASVLTALFLLAVGFIRFRHFCLKHRALEELRGQITVPAVPLPETASLIERDYQELIRLLDKERGRIVYDKDRAFQEMVEYYTIWAHQIKTPIAAMRLLLQTDSAPDKDELAEQLFRIEQYTEMVLQFIRLGGTGTDFVFRTVSLDDCIKQAVRKYAKSFIRKQIRLNYDPVDAEVLTDEKWLVFVLEQLLSNALKYTPQGEISIYMHPNRPQALVIEDTGIGIDPADLPRVFEHGYTGFNGRADKKSTGIGLYLCKRIMDKLSHTIEIESEVGRGTKVILGLESAPLDVR
jgi:signal transduction histidine kinase